MTARSTFGDACYMRILAANDGLALSQEADALILIGGEHTVEARLLTEAASDAGLRIHWLSFDSAAAQAAFAAHGAGSLRLPLVIVGGTYCFQQPKFAEIEACLETVRTFINLA